MGTLPEDTDGWVRRINELAEDGDGVLISASRPRDSLPGGEPRADRPEDEILRDQLEGPRSTRGQERAVPVRGRAGLRTPWSLPIESPEDLESVADKASFPCLLKPALSHEWKRLFGMRRVVFLRSVGELREAADAPLRAGLALFATEWIPGPETNLEGALVLRARDGSFRLSYTRRKLRQLPARLRRRRDAH